MGDEWRGLFEAAGISINDHDRTQAEHAKTARKRKRAKAESDDHGIDSDVDYACHDDMANEDAQARLDAMNARINKQPDDNIGQSARSVGVSRGFVCRSDRSPPKPTIDVSAYKPTNKVEASSYPRTLQIMYNNRKLAYNYDCNRYEEQGKEFPTDRHEYYVAKATKEAMQLYNETAMKDMDAESEAFNRAVVTAEIKGVHEQTQAEAKRQKDALKEAARKPHSARLQACPGRFDGERRLGDCIFSWRNPGAVAMVDGQCLFCDVKRLPKVVKTANGKGEIQKALAIFRSKAKDVYDAALKQLDTVPETDRRFLLVAKSKYCIKEGCEFNREDPGTPATSQKDSNFCMWCNPTALRKVESGGGRGAITQALQVFRKHDEDNPHLPSLHDKALMRLSDGYKQKHQRMDKDPNKPTYCSNDNCIFDCERPGKAAPVRSDKNLCMWCDPNQLQNAERQSQGRIRISTSLTAFYGREDKATLTPALGLLSNEYKQKYAARFTVREGRCIKDDCIFDLNNVGKAGISRTENRLCMWCDHERLLTRATDPAERGFFDRVLKNFRTKNADVFDAAFRRLPTSYKERYINKWGERGDYQKYIGFADELH